MAEEFFLTMILERAVVLEFFISMVTKSSGPHDLYRLQRALALEFFLTIITESSGPRVLPNWLDYREQLLWSFPNNDYIESREQWHWSPS